MKEQLENIVKQPRAGVYGDDDFWKAYTDLLNDLIALIPKEMSKGALQNDIGPVARARCKAMVGKARIMEDIMKAITKGR